MNHTHLVPASRDAAVVVQDDTITAIERQAQRVARRYFERSRSESERDDVAAGVELEIMLVLGHIDRIRQSQTKALDRLLELEAETNTKRMAVDSWARVYGREDTSAHFRLDDRLFKLELERLKIKISIDDKLRPHHDRLQQLLIKHTVLDL